MKQKKKRSVYELVFMKVEVVIEGSDVLGDGVNVASRLEEMTEEGCINVSRERCTPTVLNNLPFPDLFRKL